MRRPRAAALLSLLPASAAAFDVTVQEYVTQDPARHGVLGGVREVKALLYIAADAPGPAPVVAFAHGFNLKADEYPIARELAARRGITVLLPHSAGVPTTTDLAMDQAFLLDHAVAQSAGNESSPFYGRVLNRTVLSGHSLGGGSSILAADPTLRAGRYPQPGAIATLSLGTYTIPGAAKSAPRIPAGQPALLMTATQDCIDPPEKNSLPVFDALQSGCVAVVSVVGGTHCQYAAEDAACTKTEVKCGAAPNVTRAEQAEVALAVLLPYIDAALGGEWGAFSAALDAAEARGDVAVLARRNTTCAAAR